MRKAGGLGAVVVLCVVAGCGGSPAPPPGSVSCPEGRTSLDGVCVSEQIADYVGCVRAQGATFGSDKSQKVAMEVKALNVGGVEGSYDVGETLKKKYTGSDEAMLAIINACNATKASAQQPASAPAPEEQPGAQGTCATLLATGKSYPLWLEDADRPTGRREFNGEFTISTVNECEKGSCVQATLFFKGDAATSVVSGHFGGGKLEFNRSERDFKQVFQGSCADGNVTGRVSGGGIWDPSGFGKFKIN